MLLYYSPVPVSKNLNRNCLPIVRYCPVCHLWPSYMMQWFQHGLLVPFHHHPCYCCACPCIVSRLEDLPLYNSGCKNEVVKQALTLVVW